MSQQVQAQTPKEAQYVLSGTKYTHTTGWGLLYILGIVVIVILLFCRITTVWCPVHNGETDHQ